MDCQGKVFSCITGLSILLAVASADAFDAVGKPTSRHPSPEQVSIAADEAALKVLRQQMIDGWNRGSGVSFAEAFTDDAEFVAADGTKLNGRQEIAATYQRLFDSVMRGSRLAGQLKSVRFLSSGVAVMNAVAATSMPGESTALLGRDLVQTMVAVKRDGHWRIASFHDSRVLKFEQQLLLADYEALPVQTKQQVIDLVASGERRRQPSMEASIP